jgi:hypothetical protein
MKMRNFTDELRVLLFTHDVSDIIAAMPANEDPIWDVDTRRQADPAWGLGATKSIIFKWFVDPNFEWNHAQDVDPFVDKFHMDSELWSIVKPLVERIEAHHGGVAVRAYLSKLNPESMIDRHADGDCLLVPLISKNIVTIETNDDDVFEIYGTEMSMPVGEAYEIDNMKVHTGINRGMTRRIYLMVDVLPNDFQECIISGGYGEYPVTNLYATDRTISYVVDKELGRVFVTERSDEGQWNHRDDLAF